MKISNESKKHCRDKFGYKNIDKIIDRACNIIDKIGVEATISEFIYDYDDVELHNVLLFLLKENTNLKELNKK